jgi:anti-anti-sigma regulatory factor
MDLGQAGFLDSRGVRTLVDGYHSAMVAGETLGACGAPARVLRIVGLDRLLGMTSRDYDGSTPYECERPG